jgi:hypothetical protein
MRLRCVLSSGSPVDGDDDELVADALFASLPLQGGTWSGPCQQPQAASLLVGSFGSTRG